MQTKKQLEIHHEGKKEKIFTPEFFKIIISDLSFRICSLMQLSLLPLYVLDNGYSTTVAGLTMTVFTLMAILSRPASGMMVDTKGRYIVIIIGSVVYCLATGLFLFAFPIWMLLVIRTLQGFGSSFSSTGLMTLATDIIPESRMSEGIGYLGLNQTISQVFSPALALWVMNTYGYQIAFTLVFILTIINLFFRIQLRSVDKKPWYVKNLQDGSPILPKQGEKDSLLGRIICMEALKPSLLMVSITFAFSGISTFLLAFTSERMIENSGMFFTISAVALAVARLTSGRIQNKYGSAAVLVPGYSLLILGFLGIYISTDLPILLLSGVFYGLGIGAVAPAINSLAVLSVSKENRGMANSTLFMAVDLGLAVGAVSLGAIANIAGLGTVFIICSMVLLVSLLAYLILKKKYFVESKA